MLNLGYLYYIPKKKKIIRILSDVEIEKNYIKFKDKYSRTFTDYLTLNSKKKYYIPKIISKRERKKCLNCERILNFINSKFCNKDCESTYIIEIESNSND